MAAVAAAPTAAALGTSDPAATQASANLEFDWAKYNASLSSWPADLQAARNVDLLALTKEIGLIAPAARRKTDLAWWTCWNKTTAGRLSSSTSKDVSTRRTHSRDGSRTRAMKWQFDQ